MTSKLNKKEIENIAVLLLSPDSKNIELALALLEQHSYAIPIILKQIEVFLIFNPKQKELEYLVKEFIPNFELKKSPIFALSLNDFSDEALNLLEKYGAEYEKWIALDIDRTKVYAKFAELVGGATKKIELAIKYFNLTLHYFPKEEFYWLRMADTLCSITKGTTAIYQYKNKVINAYNKAFELNPTSFTLVQLANFYQNNLADLEMAKKTWEKCLERYPQHSEPLLGYTEHLVKAKDWTKAQKIAHQYLEALQPKPYLDFQTIYLLLATIEWKGFNRLETAENYYQQAYQENEDVPEPIEQLADFYLKNKELEKALIWHQKLLLFQPFNILLLCQLAELSQQIGKLAAAKSYYQQILDIAPNYEPALKGLNFC